MVGGGLAGLAATAALASRDVSVSVLESRPRLGGRASSFRDQETGEAIDNCQHVVMGCCANFHHFCRLVGIDHLFRTERELYFIGRDRRVNRFSATWLPAPLHLAKSFRKLSYFSWRELWSIARALKVLMRESFTSDSGSSNSPTQSPSSFAEWLAEQQQSDHAIRNFWQVVLVSALSESLDRIDCGYARKVFADGFLGSRRGWEVSMPIVPLDELYGTAMASWFRERNSRIQTQCGVKQVLIEGGQAVGVELRTGERLDADHVVLAVPFHLASSLFVESDQTQPILDELAGARRMESAPISSVHLWFDRPITSLPHAVLVDRFGQWVFNRSTILNELPDSTSDRQTYYYQVVISDSGECLRVGQAETVARVVQELHEVWPETADAELMHSRMVTEHRAVFSPLPGIDDQRPAQQSSVHNLQFAGDWTATDWPATMEAAVKSGYLAAENILRQLGDASQFVQPQPSLGWLSRMFFHH
ncbi:MAG: hydroxysqualene dehydroxylase HpnE [Planctomycetota bacterium]|nr:hydroxysqualene dehydroxylase HpnE [Planctomycetota bacterium]